MFYNSELEAAGDPSVTDSMLEYGDLNSVPSPVLFYGIVGYHYSDDNGGSLYNIIEAQEVVKIVKQLLTSSTMKVNTADIGIITPYRKQVLVLRKLLRSNSLGAIRIGTVEDYQGQEALCTIISTVVSRDEEFIMKLHPNIGLFNNAKQFNVALTRAQALSIVVGNPHNLYQVRYIELIYSGMVAN